MMTKTNSTFSLALLGAALLACSGADDEDPSATEGPSTGAGASGGAAAGGAGAETAGGSDGCGDGRRVSSVTPCTDDPDPCGLNSGFRGDEYCLLPPPPGEGIQIHFGPSDYTDPAELAKYTLDPDQDVNAYGIADIPLTEQKWFSHVKIQMRPGSHHLINTVLDDKYEVGFVPAGQGCPGSTVSGFPGTQNLVYESPPNGQHAPENVGLGRSLAPNTSLCVNHHGYNFTEDVQLREVWINVYFVDESEVTQRTQGIALVAGPWTPIPVGASISLGKEVEIEGSGRIISMFGHRHAWTDRFAVWHNDRLVYDSWNWQESIVFNYDSITENPPPNPEGMTDGAVSGILDVQEGDRLRFQCDVNNGNDKPLPFTNALYDGEMCILFGATVGVSIVDGLFAAR
jgi:hypothetical protein